jgi:hypothetical protein
VLVLTALLIVAMFALLAFAVDLGYLAVARVELQRTADAAATAATWDLLDEGALRRQANPSLVQAEARATAAQYAGQNLVVGTAPALAQSDVVVGYLANPMSPAGAISVNNPSRANAVQIQVRRTSEQNGQVPFFFARVLGHNGAAAQAMATAAFIDNFAGFQAPSDGSNVDLLPFALDVDTWNALVNNGVGTDNWRYDAATGAVASGADGILEVNLYPQGTGSPGNRGTVDIGSANNSTCDIARQILHGISPQDLACMGGKIEFNAQGKLYLNGDTGISAGVKDELAAIKGQPRIIPIFEAVSGNGNNANYTIVKFVGVRIMDVKLTGSMSSKRVIIQPAMVRAVGGIPSTANPPVSTYVHSPVWLVR